MNEEFQWKLATQWRDDDSVLRDTTIIRYGGVLQGIFARDFNLVFYNGLKDSWFTPSRHPGGNYDTLKATIKCEATIRYCDEVNTK